MEEKGLARKQAQGGEALKWDVKAFTDGLSLSLKGVLQT